MTLSYSMGGAVVHLARGATTRVSNSASFPSSRCTLYVSVETGILVTRGNIVANFFPHPSAFHTCFPRGEGRRLYETLLFPRRAAGLRSGGGWKQTENAADDDGAQRKFWTTPTRLWRLRRRLRRRHGNRASRQEEKACGDTFGTHETQKMSV